MPSARLVLCGSRMGKTVCDSLIWPLELREIMDVGDWRSCGDTVVTGDRCLNEKACPRAELAGKLGPLECRCTKGLCFIVSSVGVAVA
jgi:hypothetical protein